VELGDGALHLHALQRSRAPVAEHRIELNDDAAALAYACDLARDLVRTGKSADPAWRVIVVHEKRGIVLTVPLLAACA
jgi:hypothetical protein